MEFFVGIIRGSFAILVLLGICYMFSANKKMVDWKLVAKGMAIQFLLAIILFKVDFIRNIFDVIANFFVEILNFTEAGSKFLFGNIVTDVDSFGYIFAFQVLPTIIFFAAFSSILYYLGILQRIIFGFAWVMKKAMNLSGSESLAAAANVFIGQTEAPLVVKPYLEKMTRSELLCLMTGGMATIAGGVFAAYVGYLGDNFVDTTGMTEEAATAAIDVSRNLFAQHLLIASIISAPAAIVCAKILYPQDNEEAVIDDFEVPKDKVGSNLLEAIAIGTTDGLKLAINVGAMLLVFTALIAMVNYLLNSFGEFTTINDYVAGFAESLQSKGYKLQDSAMNGLNLEFLFGLVFSPIAWLLGVPSTDIFLVGQLLGQKTAINEFFAYAAMANYVQVMKIKSTIIATYALCGFANFASIGIQIGGIGAIAPGQKTTISEFGIKALIGGTIACFLTAALAGMLVQESSFIQ